MVTMQDRKNELILNENYIKRKQIEFIDEKRLGNFNPELYLRMIDVPD